MLFPNSSSKLGSKILNKSLSLASTSLPIYHTQTFLLSVCKQSRNLRSQNSLHHTLFPWGIKTEISNGSPSPQAYYMSCPSHSSSFDHLNVSLAYKLRSFSQMFFTLLLVPLYVHVFYLELSQTPSMQNLRHTEMMVQRNVYVSVTQHYDKFLFFEIMLCKKLFMNVTSRRHQTPLYSLKLSQFKIMESI